MVESLLFAAIYEEECENPRDRRSKEERGNNVDIWHKCIKTLKNSDFIRMTDREERDMGYWVQVHGNVARKQYQSITVQCRLFLSMIFKMQVYSIEKIKKIKYSLLANEYIVCIDIKREEGERNEENRKIFTFLYYTISIFCIGES